MVTLWEYSNAFHTAYEKEKEVSGIVCEDHRLAYMAIVHIYIISKNNRL